MGAKTDLCVYVVSLIILGLLAGFNIAMIVVGSLYLHDCPAERYIPIYLIVAGAFGLLLTICFIGIRVRTSLIRETQEDLIEGKDNRNRLRAALRAAFKSCLGLVTCFLLAWFIAGNSWVYSTHGNWSPDDTDVNYCHPFLFPFAFWTISITYVMLGLFCLSIIIKTLRDSVNLEV